jgi:hypothetical protein
MCMATCYMVALRLADSAHVNDSRDMDIPGACQVRYDNRLPDGTVNAQETQQQLTGSYACH